MDKISTSPKSCQELVKNQLPGQDLVDQILLLTKTQSQHPLPNPHGLTIPIRQCNLLDDQLVDVLLDSAAGGVNTVEREGVSGSLRVCGAVIFNATC